MGILGFQEKLVRLFAKWKLDRCTQNYVIAPWHAHLWITDSHFPLGICHGRRWLFYSLSSNSSVLLPNNLHVKVIHIFLKHFIMHSLLLKSCIYAVVYFVRGVQKHLPSGARPSIITGIERGTQLFIIIVIHGCCHDANTRPFVSTVFRDHLRS